MLHARGYMSIQVLQIAENLPVTVLTTKRLVILIVINILLMALLVPWQVGDMGIVAQRSYGGVILANPFVAVAMEVRRL